MQDRRRTERIRANIHARWESLATQGRGSVCDLSSSGCFVLTGGVVAPHQLIRLDLIEADHIVTVWGYVVYHIPEMGFAIRFAFQGETDQQTLRELQETVRQTHV